MIEFSEFLAEAATTGAIKHLTHLAGEEHFYGKERTKDDLERLDHLHKFAKGENSNVDIELKSVDVAVLKLERL